MEAPAHRYYVALNRPAPKRANGFNDARSAAFQRDRDRMVQRSLDAANPNTIAEVADQRPVRQLPAEAEMLAREIASWLNLETELSGPLARFFSTASLIRGIEGFGIVLRKEPARLPVLSISAFTDLGPDRVRSVDSPRSQVADKFDTFERTVGRVVIRRVLPELRYVDARPQDLAEIAASFPQGLVDPWQGELNQEHDVQSEVAEARA